MFLYPGKTDLGIVYLLIQLCGPDDLVSVSEHKQILSGKTSALESLYGGQTYLTVNSN